MRSRRLSPSPALAVLAAVALAALAPGAAAQPALSYTLEPASPEVGEVVLLTIRQEVFPDCMVLVESVEPHADGIRVRLPETLVPFIGDPYYPCLVGDGASAAFIVPRTGPWRLQLVDHQGAPLIGETLDVAGDEPVFESIVEVRPGPPSSLRVHAEGVWSGGLPPTLRRIERNGQVVEVFLEGRSAGLAAIVEWKFESVVGGLVPVAYSVVVRADTVDGRPISRGVAYSPPPSCFGAGLLRDDHLDPYLCLHDGRFEVRAWHRLGSGKLEPAGTLGLTPRSGAFWFFHPDNLELTVKVLDGCAAFDRFWVFASGLTDVGVRIEVTDTWTGEIWTHKSEPGEGFDEVRDTGAFATCDAVP